MAMSYEQFMQASGAELVCGNIIIGTLGDRKKIGDRLDGVFNLNEEGQKVLIELESKGVEQPVAEKPAAKTRGKKKENSAPEMLDLGDNISIPKVTDEDMLV